MRIVSLNTGGGRFFDALVGWVRETDADVWCFQEVTRAPGGESGWLDFIDGDVLLPQRADLFRDLSDVLPGHDGTFLPAATGLLHDRHGTLVPNAFGLATFVRSRLPVIGATAKFVHGCYSPDGWGEHPRPRNAHGVRIWDAARDRAITVVQIHGLRDPAGKHDTPPRMNQALALRDLIADTRGGSDEATVVCGDFNLLPESWTFEVLAEIGLVDLVTTRGFTDTRTSHYRKPGRHANYLLVNAAAEVRAFDVVTDPEVSDHRALSVEIA